MKGFIKIAFQILPRTWHRKIPKPNCARSPLRNGCLNILLNSDAIETEHGCLDNGGRLNDSTPSPESYRILWNTRNNRKEMYAVSTWWCWFHIYCFMYFQWHQILWSVTNFVLISPGGINIVPWSEGGDRMSVRKFRCIRSTSIRCIHPKGIGVKKNANWSRYRPGVAQRVGRGIALLFHDLDTRREMSGQSLAPAALCPR
jgi:hypothetical protein